MTRPYNPHKGSMAEQVIAYLQKHGRTPVNRVAEALGTTKAALHGNLTTAFERGAIKKGHFAGMHWFWVGDGTPEAPTDADEPLEHAQHTRHPPSAELQSVLSQLCAGPGAATLAQVPQVPELTPTVVPCIQTVTISFTCTPHQAERIAAFAKEMTEVRS